MNMSLVIITPVSLTDQADACLAALGWGTQNFLVELGGDADGPPCHHGLRATVTTEFVKALQDRIATDQALVGGLLIDLRPDAKRMGHFDAVLAQNGLARMAPPHMDWPHMN
ncbi:hypothetical protein [Roseinatronobacter sp.]